MRILQALTAALLVSTAAWALPTFPTSFQDALDSDDPSDVIGDPAKFEIYSLSLTGINGNTLQVDIRFNFGGGTSLSGFKSYPQATYTLNVGDLFFRTGSNTYAYILNGHDGLSTNGLYTITGTQSARDVLGNPNSTYRPDAQVWASPTGAQLLGIGSSSINTVNNIGTNLLASLFLPFTSNAIADLNNGFSIYFAAATCGNDEIIGGVPSGDDPGTPTPEPGTWAMFGAGLIGLGLLRRGAK
ncbi:MAG: PEP-CTERM sorting domain-containing protein [Acidobacteria bacterium]|nr:PEP-CTERM sorting domain-containing protein [Acidobacteriota bacterium]